MRRAKTTSVRWILNRCSRSRRLAPPHGTRITCSMSSSRDPSTSARWAFDRHCWRAWRSYQRPQHRLASGARAVDVGMLTLDRVEAEEFSPATDINFDPLTLPAGMAPRTIRCSALVRQSYARSFAPARRRDQAAERDHTRGRKEGRIAMENQRNNTSSSHGCCTGSWPRWC